MLLEIGPRNFALADANAKAGNFGIPKQDCAAFAEIARGLDQLVG
jgi:hypothetical protein